MRLEKIKKKSGKTYVYITKDTWNPEKKRNFPERLRVDPELVATMTDDELHNILDCHDSGDFFGEWGKYDDMPGSFKKKLHDLINAVDAFTTYNDNKYREQMLQAHIARANVAAGDNAAEETLNWIMNHVERICINARYHGQPVPELTPNRVPAWSSVLKWIKYARNIRKSPKWRALFKAIKDGSFLRDDFTFS